MCQQTHFHTDGPAARADRPLRALKIVPREPGSESFQAETRALAPGQTYCDLQLARSSINVSQCSTLSAREPVCQEPRPPLTLALTGRSPRRQRWQQSQASVSTNTEGESGDEAHTSGPAGLQLMGFGLPAASDRWRPRLAQFSLGYKNNC